MKKKTYPKKNGILHAPFYTFSNEIHIFRGDCHSESVKYFHDHMKDARKTNQNQKPFHSPSGRKNQRDSLMITLMNMKTLNFGNHCMNYKKREIILR